MRLTTILFLLLITPLALAQPQFDLGLINYPDPVIGVEFSEPVTLVSSETRLTPTQTPGSIDLVITPEPDDEYNSEYEIAPEEDLAQGDYTLQVLGESALGLPMLEYGLVNFTVTGLQAKMTSPPSGYAAMTPYDVRVRTYVEDGDDEIYFNAHCKYYLGTNVPEDFDATGWNDMSASQQNDDPNQYQGSGVGTLHEAANLETPQSILWVTCQRYKQDGTIAPPTILESYDIGTIEDGPSMTITTTPPEVNDANNPYTSLVVETDQETYCSVSDGDETVPVTPGLSQDDYEDYDDTHNRIIRYDNDDGINEHIDDTEYHERTYEITCQNLAGTSITKEHTISIDLDVPLEITIDRPATITNEEPVPVIAYTNMESTCTANGDSMSTGALTHTAQLTSTDPASPYELVIDCEAGEKAASVTHEFTTDRLAPSNVAIDAQEYVCSQEASATVTAEDNDQIRRYHWNLTTASGERIAGGVSENGEVSAQITTDEELTWEAVAEDRAGNKARADAVSVTPAAGNSDECDPGPFIRYHEPALGHDTNSFTPTIETKRPASCGYLYHITGTTPGNNHIAAESEDDVVHTLGEIDGANERLHISCEEEADGTVHEQVLDFGVITQQINIVDHSAAPNPVYDFVNRNATINVVTNNKASCTLTRESTIPFEGADPDDATTYETEHEHTLDLSWLQTPESQEIEYTIRCEDLAGQSASKTLTLVLDFSGAEIIIHSPERYTTQSNVELIVEPQVQASCEYRDPDTGHAGSFNEMQAQSGGNHTATIPSSLDEGSHSILVRCQDATGETLATIVQFTIDNTPPALALSTDNDYLCKDSTAALRLDINETSSYTTTITPQGSANSTNTSADRYEIDAQEYPLGPLTLNAITTDAAGNPSQQQSHTIEVLAADNQQCTDQPEPTECPHECISDSECNEECATHPACEEDIDCPDTENPDLVCETDSDCASAEICVSGTCQEEEATPECTTTNDCAPGEACVAGSCQAEETPPSEEGGFPWVAIALIVLGLFAMGGAGYYLYEARANTPQTPGGFQQPPQMPPSAPQKTPAKKTAQPQTPSKTAQPSTQNLDALKQEAERKTQALRKHEEEIAKKRKTLMSSFEEEEDKKPQTTEQKTESKAGPAEEEKGYLTLDELDKKKGEKEEPSESEEKDAQKKKKQSDAFDELDDFIGK